MTGCQLPALPTEYAAFDNVFVVDFWKKTMAEKHTRAINDTRRAYSTRLLPSSPVNRFGLRPVEDLELITSSLLSIVAGTTAGRTFRPAPLRSECED
jgi:hypothetical protein